LKPRILIETIALLIPLTGIGRYTLEISKRLRKDESFEYYYFYGFHSKELILDQKESKLKRLKQLLKSIPVLKKMTRKIINIISKFTQQKYDLYWQPNFIPNDTIKAKKIVTSVHDFSFILYEKYHPKERIEHFKKYFFKNIYLSDAIITGSQYSKSEILERLDFKDKDVHVIYHGIDHNIFRLYSNIELEFELPKKFLLSVGSIEPRKNLIGLLEAYNALSNDIKEEYKLVLVGFKGWENKEIMKLIEANKENIIYLGFITDQELAKVYNLASIFVFPSFYEGFGLPIIEAFACGTPVLSSNATSLPEVGGDAVLYCDPHDSKNIAEKLVLLIENSDLQNDLRVKGLERAKQFSWEKSAQQHQALFERLLS